MLKKCKKKSEFFKLPSDNMGISQVILIILIPLNGP